MFLPSTYSGCCSKSKTVSNDDDDMPEGGIRDSSMSFLKDDCNLELNGLLQENYEQVAAEV